MSFFIEFAHDNGLRTGKVEGLAAYWLKGKVGSGTAKSTVDQTSIRGLATA